MPCQRSGAPRGLPKGAERKPALVGLEARHVAVTFFTCGAGENKGRRERLCQLIRVGTKCPELTRSITKKVDAVTPSSSGSQTPFEGVSCFSFQRPGKRRRH